MNNDDASATRVRRFKLLHPRPPHIGFLIDNPQDYYVDWDETGLDQWREV